MSEQQTDTEEVSSSDKFEPPKTSRVPKNSLRSSPIDPEKIPEFHEGFIGTDFFSEEDEWKATTVGYKPSGREVQIRKNREGKGYVINFENPVGRLHKDLKGVFTTFSKARRAAATYLNRVWEEYNEEQQKNNN